VRGLVVAAVASEGEEPAVIPLGRARAVLRLVAHSANAAVRQEERPAILRDLLAAASSFEIRYAPSADGLALPPGEALWIAMQQALH
jgi:hypothetical protein